MSNVNSPIVILNKTSTDLRGIMGAIIAAAKNGGKLPEELADIFTLSRVKGNALAESTGRPCWAVDFSD